MSEKENAAPSRLVVFVGGFDPRGGRYYHRLCAQQARLQAQVDQAEYAVGELRALQLDEAGKAHSVWTLAGSSADASEYVFFDWTDHIRAHWPKSLYAVCKAGLRTYGEALISWRSLRSLGAALPYTLLAFVYPLIFMLLLGLFGVAGFYGTWHAGADWPWWSRALACLGVVSVVAWGGKKLDGLLHISWLLRIFNFARSSARTSESGATEHERIHDMAQWLAQRVRQQPDLELVVLGFSVGSAQSIKLLDALSDVLRSTEVQPVKDRVTLLTLGNCIPLFSFFPTASGFRSSVSKVAADPEIYWVDISSPGDSVSFGMCDLLQLALPDASPANESYVNPRHMCTPRFHKLFEPRRYRFIRRNKMRMHFQYLMASEKAGAYNFFAMLTAPTTVRKYVEKFLVR
ncbi:hypothetical protein [Comamonas sp. lk]|uniref:hypothetical protein n=1 Tax=Comamonas sp. lk TaxID=2201272 RepID=UPI000EABFB53|nr:hypothetical protein [Comamonas sp. lk]